MKKVTKPYKNIDELINILINKGLYISDKVFAKYALSSLSYFDLINGYKRYFTKDNRYIPGISLGFLYNFRLYDLDIQNILFKYSVTVETRFKNILAMNLGELYGSHQDDYLNKFYYAHGSGKREKRFDKVMHKIRNVYSPNNRKYGIDQPTRHFINKHGYVPPWILLKNVTFSSAIDLFSFANDNLKRKVAFELMGTSRPKQDYKLALNCLYTVRKFRNAIAHNLKFISLRLNTSMAISRSDLVWEFHGTMIKETDPKYVAKGDPYSMLLAMVLLLKENELIEDLFYELAARISRNQDDDIVNKYSDITNIPPDFVKRGYEFLGNRKLGKYWPQGKWWNA